MSACVKQRLVAKPGGGYEWVPVEKSSVPRSTTGGWPIVSYTAGVHASQAQDLRDYCDQMGVPTEVTKAGDPIFRSERHMAAHLAARGMCNKDGVFSCERKI